MQNKGIDNIKGLISKDIWSVIKDNYERGSYTTAITNLVQYINETIQDKANLENADNTSLIEQAFFGKNPKLQINKLQTRSEKDIQEGVGHLFKGACLAIRNPRSHERYTDDKLTADRIILFYDYVLDFVCKSEQPKLVYDWIEFIFDKDFVSTKQYAEETLKEIPQKKRYDLLVSIFRNRENGIPNKLNCIVEELMNSISPDEYNEFIKGLNKELIYCNNDNKLTMFFNLFPASQWNKLEKLPKLRAENIVLKAITNATVEYEEDVFGHSYDCYISSNGMLAAQAIEHIPMFDTFDDIKRAILDNARKDKSLFDDYFMKYFSQYLDLDNIVGVSDVDPNDLPY
ncbi:MAG: TIGR02391 family protein [Hydrogenoanaerobacterium sp.]